MTPAANTAERETGVYWEPRVNSFVATVQPGAFRVTGRSDLALSTLLGSCVAACICDTEAAIGGINHFLLPDDAGAVARDRATGSGAGHAARYGVHAMEDLINEVLKQGGRRGRLAATLFGGPTVIAASGTDPVGDRNQRFTIEFLRREGVPITAADMGGERARRLFFRPAANRVLVQVLDRGTAERVRKDEAVLRRSTGAAPSSGGVELF